MPNYVLAQIISLLVMFIGWCVMIGGTFVTLIFFDKTKITTLLPVKIGNIITLVPDWIFYIPSAIIFIIGLLIIAFGHLVQASLDNSRFTAESAQILELIRVRGLQL